MQPIAILVVEDNDAQRKIMEFNLSREGYTVLPAGTIGQAMALMKGHRPDAVVTDVMLPDGSGIELLERLLRIDPDLVVIVVTAYGTIRMAVDAIKKGACDYLTKPYEKEELLLSIRHALKARAGVQGRERHEIIGRSDAIRGIMDMIGHIADSDVPVLITGESGTGKEVVARALHAAGTRRDRPFVPINCAAIPSDMLEAELFGHTKGAFTGALKDKPGRLESADRGTLFLDEIGSMDIALQPKLLRAIETGYIERLGAVEGRKLDTRIVSATNADLIGMIRQGLFREDLYYRLNVVNIHIPPLRERREDIPLLVDHFMGRYASGRRLSLGQDALDVIMGRPWYGNAREIENFIRRLVVIHGSGTVTGRDLVAILPLQPSPRVQTASVSDESMDEAEKRMVLSALDSAGHNISKAAKLLKIPRHKLVYRMKKYGIGPGAAP
ncbi:MAG: sigma-54 dependent transcriptional regulator [Deltaproteobacteria bacterium]|nr:sigma-54 dependent transcriptional regulator [Deltaproteobacteria bacterium]